MDSSASATRQHLLVAVSGSANSEQLVRDAHALAVALRLSWEAIHIETPDTSHGAHDEVVAADALSLAAKLGATIATIPSPSVADGIIAHLRSSPAQHLVLGLAFAENWRLPWQHSLVEQIVARDQQLLLHLRGRSDGAPKRARTGESGPERRSASAYILAAALVAGTLIVAELLQLFLGTRPLDLLFLFPVIAVAARRGLAPALFAAALSVISYNFFLLSPQMSFAPAAPQNLVMIAVLAAVAAYTHGVTSRMRGRLRLSDRSARENASVAALAQKLARDADWRTTAQTVCEHVHSLLQVQTLLYREFEGELVVEAALPPATPLAPVDRAALKWVWQHGEEAGAGTAMLAAADWQFQPLKTSLGVLAVLGIARDDGRDPVRPEQRILLHTLVAQAALAHERLRLEDQMRAEARWNSVLR